MVFTRFLEDLRSQGRLEPTLVIVPTRLLKQQTENRLREHGFKGKIAQVSGTTGVVDADIHITTQAGFARQIHEHGRGIIPERIGNIIFDEVHHIQGESTQLALEKAFRHARIIGFTATPDYDNKRLLRNILPDLIHEITPTEAIDEGLTTPYVTVGLPTYADMRDVVVLGKEYHQKLLRQALEKDDRDRLIASYYRENMHGIPTLFNMSWVEHAERMAATLREFGVRAETVHGGMKEDHEDRVLKAFEAGEIDVITQVRKLGEGQDIKRIAAVVNVIPTKSKVLSMQRVGRAQRTDESQPGKVTLVVECIDQDYNGKPAFYGSDAVTGLWAYGVDPVYAERFTGGDFHAFYDPQQLDDWYTSGWTPNGQSHSLIERIDTDSYETVQPLPKSVRNPLATPRRGRSRPQRTASHPRAKRTNKAAEARKQQHIFQKQEKKRSLKEQAADFFKEQGESGLDERMRSFRTDEEQLVAAYIINGNELPPISIKPYVLKRVLATLAGDEITEDNEVMSRFRKISGIASGRDDAFVEDKETGNHEVNRSSAYRKRSDAASIIDKPHFENANCELSDKDATPEQLREHMDKFFPDRGRSTILHKVVCYTCQSRGECLEYAIVANQKHGIWGGTSERQRRKLRKTLDTEGQTAFDRQLIGFYKKDIQTFENNYECGALPSLTPITETPVQIRQTVASPK